MKCLLLSTKGESNEFIRLNNKDVKHEFKENFTVEGYKEALLIIPEDVPRSKMMSVFMYTIFSLFLLSWPYRKWFDTKSNGTMFLIVKSFRV
jgi:hypothetical protein